MFKNFLSVAFLAFSPLLAAQLSPRNEDIVKMVKAGLGEDLIITTINASPGYYDTSVGGLAALKTAGVTDKELSAIVHKAFQICFAGTGQDQTQGLNLGQMEKLLQDAHCGPLPSAAPAPVSNALPTAPSPTAAPALPAQALAQQPPMPAQSTSKPRVLLTLANSSAGQSAPQDQSMQMSKEFAQNCPGAQVTIDPEMIDYTVFLNSVQDSAVQYTQIRITNKDGNLISNTKESESIDGGVKKACNVIMADWAKSKS
jgi:hypothetical protein